MRYGLIGEKLGHSYSKIIHEKLADYTYDLIPLSREEFDPFMEKKDFTAINVTIPYKQAVIPYLDELDPLAKEIGAVNTVVNRKGHCIGYNTDFYGFKYMLLHNNIQIQGKKCLVLGNGGTSRTVQAVLKHLGAAWVLVVSRSGSNENGAGNPVTDNREAVPGLQGSAEKISYETCYAGHTDAAIIVNTTPLGMYPNLDAAPLDLTGFTECEAVVDVIFNPLKTKIALQAQALGIKAVTGLEMLVAQAKQAIEYFLDTKLDDGLIEQVHQELLETLKK
ncbi:MAG TPA: shikimate dehydrogenase [Clostridiales bacterium]|nr:shikimate dehydrogenase [Clostridiales bacterium]